MNDVRYYLCDLSSYDVSQIKGAAILQMETLAEMWAEQGFRQACLQNSQTVAERALRAIQRKFGTIEEETQARVRALSFDQLADLVEALLDFNSADDLAAWLSKHAPKDSEEKIN